MRDTPLDPGTDAFPTHAWDALDLPPRVHSERIGGAVTVLEKDLPEGSVLLLTAGVSRLPVDAGPPVELAVEVAAGQQGAGLIALRIVCDDVAQHRRTPPVGSPWRNAEPFLRGTGISALVATASRWGSSFDDVRAPDGSILGHVRTLRLLTDAEAALVAERGWTTLVQRAGNESTLLDVTRASVVEDGAAGPTRTSGPPRNRSVVIRTKLHEQHPPRWVTLADGVFQSVTGLESPEYMADNDNHEFVAVETFVRAFPWTAEFVRTAPEGRTGFFADASGSYTLED